MDTALKRTCMRDRIRDVLVARILDGTYPAGLQLKELSLAREFNVSQAPIREALRELEGTGLVTSERYRGTRVRGADSVEMRESYELRLMMEVRSIERGLPLTTATLDKLESCITRMAQAVASGDSEHYIDGALDFHRNLVEMGGNGTFLKLWDSLHWDVAAASRCAAGPPSAVASHPWWPCIGASCTHCAPATRPRPSRT